MLCLYKSSVNPLVELCTGTISWWLRLETATYEDQSLCSSARVSDPWMGDPARRQWLSYELFRRFWINMYKSTYLCRTPAPKSSDLGTSNRMRWNSSKLPSCFLSGVVAHLTLQSTTVTSLTSAPRLSHMHAINALTVLTVWGFLSRLMMSTKVWYLWRRVIIAQGEA